MKIVFATSEAVPFAKTGGLADVSGTLPLALARRGHQVTVILPAYRHVHLCGMPIRPLGIEFIVQVGSKTVSGHLLESVHPHLPVSFILIRQDYYYDREELYSFNGQDYADNCERFVFLSRGVMESIRLLDLQPDIIHANDWQTGLVPAYLKIEYGPMPPYQNAASIFTVHNMAYQGQFWHWDMLLTGLDWKYFNWRQMEFYGKLNLLKTGFVFADAITTVSPRYAQEIQTPEFGYGLEGILRERRDDLFGILNGVDYEIWNPDVDKLIAVNYGPENVRWGKPQCKRALQEAVGLPCHERVPLIGMIGRLAEQKGFDLVADLLETHIDAFEAQWVILGAGDPGLQDRFRGLAERHPDRVAVRVERSEQMAHQIIAGSDMFLMPSRFEPCGLTQMYSLKYGTVPIVHETGGLADTITDTNEATLSAGSANGFVFHVPEVYAMNEALHRAIEAYHNPEVWDRIVAVGMRQDWSWDRSARQYEELYERTRARRGNT
ncbi:MAG: glycogen synthase GlgA [Planctomycetota bacterium]|nr:MAG: glycogen synthase GlgA [Planctomycetota bacterium]